MKSLIAGLLCTTVASLLSTNASATTVHHEVNANGAGVCTPAYSNQVVRNRTTGVRNTGTAAIYVVCSLPGDYGGSLTDNVYVRVANYSTGAQSIGCNLAPGWSNGVTDTTSQGSAPKNAVLNPGTYTWLQYYSSSYPSTTSTGFYNVNIVCLLPPNMELQYVGYEKDDNVGA